MHIQLALTAASPIWRGYLSDVDCRWNVIAGSVDDRTAEERGRVVNKLASCPANFETDPTVPQPLKENKYVIPKSRYDSVDLYLSTDWNNKPAYNDTDVPYDQEIYTRLVDHGTYRIMEFLFGVSLSHLFEGIDELLSKHMAHIFIRDPLVIFSETINQDDETSNDHFEVSAVYLL